MSAMPAPPCSIGCSRRRRAGKFLLRIDDTDTERSKPEYEAAIVDDLGWLGLAHDVFARQIERAGAHHGRRRKAEGRWAVSIPVTKRADELDRRRKRQIAQGKPPVYDRAALNLSAEDRAKLEAEGRKPHWRFKLSHEKVQVARSRPRRSGDRHRHAVRSRADPRGRPLPLHAAIGRGRHRFQRHPHHSRRGSRHQHRRADRTVPGARRARAGVRAFSAAGRLGRRGAVQAHRLALAARGARRRHRAAGARLLSRQDRHLRCRSN